MTEKEPGKNVPSKPDASPDPNSEHKKMPSIMIVLIAIAAVILIITCILIVLRLLKTDTPDGEPAVTPGQEQSQQIGTSPRITATEDCAGRPEPPWYFPEPWEYTECFMVTSDTVYYYFELSEGASMSYEYADETVSDLLCNQMGINCIGCGRTHVVIGMDDQEIRGVEFWCEGVTWAAFVTYPPEETIWQAIIKYPVTDEVNYGCWILGGGWNCGPRAWD